MKKRAQEPCELCDGTLVSRRVTLDSRWGGELIVVEQVPAQVCARCGYKQFSAPVVRRLDRLRSGRRSPLKKLTVPVFSFSSER